MPRNRLLTLSFALLIAATLLSACATSQPQDSEAVAMAVEATLTAVAANEASPNSPAATPSAVTPPPDAPTTPKTILPPRVNGFDPAPRPASSKGDPNAPVVIYEWSDYT